jgi:hypothetical protein
MDLSYGLMPSVAPSPNRFPINRAPFRAFWGEMRAKPCILGANKGPIGAFTPKLNLLSGIFARNETYSFISKALVVTTKAMVSHLVPTIL